MFAIGSQHWRECAGCSSIWPGTPSSCRLPSNPSWDPSSNSGRTNQHHSVPETGVRLQVLELFPHIILMLTSVPPATETATGTPWAWASPTLGTRTATDSQSRRGNPTLAEAVRVRFSITPLIDECPGWTFRHSESLLLPPILMKALLQGTQVVQLTGPQPMGSGKLGFAWWTPPSSPAPPWKTTWPSELLSSTTIKTLSVPLWPLLSCNPGKNFWKLRSSNTFQFLGSEGVWE